MDCEDILEMDIASESSSFLIKRFTLLHFKILENCISDFFCVAEYFLAKICLDWSLQNYYDKL